MLLFGANCTLLFPFAEPDEPLVVVDNDRPVPPPDQAPVFGEPQLNAVQVDGERFGAAVAVGHFTRTDLAELAVGIPGANGGVGLVVIHTADDAGNPKTLSFDPPTHFDLQETGESFGTALVAGRFDEDELDDLAIGAPRAGRGVVCVLYGDAQESGQFRGQVLGSQTGGGPNDARRSFGEALARGDFDEDGLHELVVGEPAGANPEVDGELPGTVWVYWGAPGGLDDYNPMAVRLDEEPPPRARFGCSLAVGNFVASGDDLKFLDLAVGAVNVPGTDAGGDAHEGVGRVWIFRPVVRDGIVDSFEAEFSLQPVGDWTRYVRSFGHSLATGNFNDDGEGAGPGRRFFHELVIGAPGSSIPANGLDTTTPTGAAEQPGAGLVCIARHDQQRLASANLLMISQEGLGLPEATDHFGWSLAAGDFNSDGVPDLAVGSPDERLDAGPGPDGFDTADRAGAVYFRFGAAGEGLDGGISVQPQACYDYLATVPAPGWSREGDRFGSVLLAADADGDGDTDLVVGAPDTDTASVMDAGAVWIGRNDTTPPGPLDGRFAGLVGDCNDVAELSLALLDRDGVVCGHLRLENDLCVDVEGTEVTVEQFVDVVSTERNGHVIDLHYTVEARGGEEVGTLLISAEVLDEQADMMVTFTFESEETGAIHRGPIILERQ